MSKAYNEILMGSSLPEMEYIYNRLELQMLMGQMYQLQYK